MRPAILIALAMLPLAGCASFPGSDGQLAGQAMMMRSDGSPAGMAMLYRTDGGMRVDAQLTGLPPGNHGLHLHTVGRCDGPGFESAGGHLNPTNNDHGFDGAGGPHLGDLTNVQVGTDGAARYSATLPELPVMAQDAIFDADGAAVMVHAGPDDYRTDPSGASGPRIACGVLIPA